MNWFLQGLLRPISNREYNPHHKRLWLLVNVPGMAVTFGFAVFISPWFLLILAVYPIDYFLLDRFLDKLAWRLVWRHFYSHKSSHQLTTQEQLMKQYEQDPTPENHRLLTKNLHK